MENKEINSIKSLSTNTITNIREAISTELLKRGFTARLFIEQKKSINGNYYEFISEPFQTVPVIFKEIRVDGRLSIAEHKENENLLLVGVRIGVRYDHFSYGTNGCELFSFSCIVLKEREDILDIKTA